MNLVVLDANQPVDRFYRGGAKIDAFREVTPGPDHRPEDWVGSVTTLAGEQSLGLTTLPDGRLLADAIAADPAAWLGAAHVEAFGETTMILVKLLDAGQRLPVHAHPHDDFSRAHLHRPFGKAEAWYIVEGGTVFVGLKEDTDRESLHDLVRTQDTAALLALLHERKVAPGDVVYVPAGELHAIGEGVFLVEVQQPEDLSILLEWDGFGLDGEADGHVGVGFDLALQAVTMTARSDAEIDALVRPGGAGRSILPPESAQYFEIERREVSGAVDLEPGFAILIVERGSLSVTPEHGEALSLRRGATVAVPHAAGWLGLDGEGVVLLCRPPRA